MNHIFRVSNKPMSCGGGGGGLLPTLSLFSILVLWIRRTHFDTGENLFF